MKQVFSRYSDIYFNSFPLLFAIILPFHQLIGSFPLISYLIALLILALLTMVFVQKISFAKSYFQKCLPQVLLVCLFIISLLWSQNFSYGIDKIVLYLPFIIFPIYFSIKPSFDFRKVKYAFIAANFIAVLYCLLFASVAYFTAENLAFRFFQYSALSAPLNLHPTYFSFYIITAATFLFFTFDIQVCSIKRVVAILFILLLFLIFIFLLSSRVAIITSVPLFIYFFYKFFNQLFNSKIVKSLLLLLFVLVIGIFIISAPTTHQRIDEAVKVLFGETDITEARSLNNRKISWYTAIDLILSHPFYGTGIGDMADKMNEQYIIKGELRLAERSLNTHNQFLQSTLAAGIPAFLLLCWLLLKNLKYAYDKKAFVFLIWLIVLLAVIMTESIFETQAGVLFTAFFISFFIYEVDVENEVQTKN